MEQQSLRTQALAVAEAVNAVREAPMFSKAAAGEKAMVESVRLIAHMCARIEALEADAKARRAA